MQAVVRSSSVTPSYYWWWFHSTGDTTILSVIVSIPIPFPVETSIWNYPMLELSCIVQGTQSSLLSTLLINNEFILKHSISFARKTRWECCAFCGWLVVIRCWPILIFVRYFHVTRIKAQAWNICAVIYWLHLFKENSCAFGTAAKTWHVERRLTSWKGIGYSNSQCIEVKRRLVEYEISVPKPSPHIINRLHQKLRKKKTLLFCNTNFHCLLAHWAWSLAGFLYKRCATQNVTWL